jgi:hypothetical protein
MNLIDYTNFDTLEHQRRFREGLRAFDFPKRKLIRTKPFLFGAGLVLTAVVYAVFALTLPLKGTDGISAAVGITTIVAAFAYWQSGRYEAATDRYYDRINLANTRYEKLSPDAYLMYMFMEVDNLEWVIEKYKWGYITPEQAFRGLKLFYTHCREIQERVPSGTKLPLSQLADAWVDKGGYLTTTCRVVKSVCEAINRAQAADDARKNHSSNQKNPVRSRAPWAGVGLVAAALLAVVWRGRIGE